MVDDLDLTFFFFFWCSTQNQKYGTMSSHKLTIVNIRNKVSFLDIYRDKIRFCMLLKDLWLTSIYIQVCFQNFLNTCNSFPISIRLDNKRNEAIYKVAYNCPNMPVCKYCRTEINNSTKYFVFQFLSSLILKAYRTIS